jgi:cell division inhibitor SepF
VREDPDLRRRDGRGDDTVEAVVRPIPSPAPGKVHFIEPTGFNDAEEIGEKFKADIPVIVNLQGMEGETAKRLIDFAAGLTFGLDGRIQKVADKVFLLTPRNVEVTAEERRRLQERGFFNQV